MTLMFAFVLRTVLLLSQSTVFFVFSQLLFAGRCFEWLLLLLDGFMFGLQLGAWELDLCCSIASNFLRHDNITGFEQAMVVSDLACVSRFTLLFLRIIITGVGQKQGTRGRHCNKIEARRRFNKEELNIYDVVKADIVTEMELVHKKLDNVMTELRKQLIAQPMPPAAPAAPAPPTRAGPPPPPPPPPPPAFFAPRPVEIKVAKKMAAKSNETRNTARAIDMSEVLKEMGNVTLRRVSRSPGGTPRRASLPNGVKIADLVDRGRKEILAKARASRRLSVTSFGAGDVV